MSQRTTSTPFTKYSSLYTVFQAIHTLKVSWMRLDNKTTEPSLLAVGQFVFTKDKRVAVTVQPAISRYSLTIVVSNPRLISIQLLIDHCPRVLRTASCQTPDITSARSTRSPI